MWEVELSSVSQADRTSTVTDWLLVPEAADHGLKVITQYNHTERFEHVTFQQNKAITITWNRCSRSEPWRWSHQYNLRLKLLENEALFVDCRFKIQFLNVLCLFTFQTSTSQAERLVTFSVCLCSQETMKEIISPTTTGGIEIHTAGLNKPEKMSITSRSLSLKFYY